ncbi:MAG: tRNA (adenosine(37)-N6)-threonylcarbamoyltransferase complex transferase subunit TsaD [Nitrospinae bacterium]|nr:tRNA (adenosine(37)-N6)-threonylcarbamoyltransferase complex transferase subunit TsaD [Nitrospinota bacterium]
MLILGIETSCDETAAAVVEEGLRVRSNIVSSQLELHSPYGGVVPELACRMHVENILPVISEALSEGGVSLEEIDLIAVTRGPGLIGALLVGLSTAKGLAYAQRKPLVGVNHLVGHIYAAFLEQPSVPFPFLALVVSGGHTELYRVKEHARYTLLGSTRDDAAGEAFDKVAKMLDLGYPGGPIIDRSARQGDPQAIDFPRAYLGKDSLDFSFSGLKTAVQIYLKRHPQLLAQEAEERSAWVCNVAASFQQAVVEVLVAKTIQAAQREKVASILLVGGVACNTLLRRELRARGEEIGLPVFYPSPVLCTDNAAMIACAAYFHGLKEGFPPAWPPHYLEMDAVAALQVPEG